MADITHHIGIWPRNYGPSDADVIAGTGAVTKITRVDASGVTINQGFSGLVQATDYDAEWVAIDDGANEVRATTVQFRSGVPAVSLPPLTSIGRHLLHLVELDLDYCQNTYGVLPCTASEPSPLECGNTRATCQDPDNFNSAPKSYGFSDIDAYTVDGYLPCIESVSMAPTRIIPGGGLSSRAKITVTMRDFPHHDRGYDPYIATRGYIARDQGTFFGKLIARNPYYWGRPLRLIIGTPGEDHNSIVKTGEYTFLIDKVEGPNANGRVKITGRDPLMLTDSEKAQCPPLSSGALSSDVGSNVTNFFDLYEGQGAEYPASGVLRINSELLSYASISGDRLSSLSRGLLGTVAEDHETDALVQLCQYYAAETPIDIINDLLTSFASIPSAVIPFTDWQTEQATWFAGVTLTNVISEPTDVSRLLKDICEQSALNLFWDPAANQMKLLADYRTELFADLNTYTDASHLLDGKSALARDPKKRVSQVWVYHSPNNYIDSSKAKDFQGAELRVDLEAESADFYGQKQINTIFAAWIDSAQFAGQLASRILKRFTNPPITAKFDLDIKDSGTTPPGKHFYIDSAMIQTALGANNLTLFQMLSAQYQFGSAVLRCEALSFSFPGRPALINEDGAPEYSPDGAHRARAYICDSVTLKMGNGDDPYQIV